MLKWMQANEKICLSGDFSQDYWRQRYPDQTDRIVFTQEDLSLSRICEYALSFEASREKRTVSFFYGGQPKIDIEIKNGSLDECVDSILNCGCGLVGMDLYDLQRLMRSDEATSVYYGGCDVSEAIAVQKKYYSQASVFLVIYASEGCQLLDVEAVFAQIVSQCNPKTEVFWQLHLEADRDEYTCDLFIGGKALPDDSDGDFVD